MERVHQDMAKVMPHHTEWQQAANDLYAAFVATLIAEGEAAVDSESSSSSSNSSSSSSNSGYDDDGPPSHLWLLALQEYLNECKVLDIIQLPSPGNQQCLLQTLGEVPFDLPEPYVLYIS